MQQSARHAARRSIRLTRAIRSFAESLEPRLLLSTYTVTNTNDSGPGSLRDAIQNSPATSISVRASGTIALSSMLEISRSLAIVGPGADMLSVSGRNVVRVFKIDSGVRAEIDALTITNGRAPDGSQGAAATTISGPGGTGGDGGPGGGILNLGTLTLKNDAISNNQAGAGGTGGTGAGGVNAAKPVLGSPGGPGGIGGAGGAGGGVYSSGSLMMLDDTVFGNRAGSGGTGGIGGTGAPSGNGNSGSLGGKGGAGGVGGDGGAIYAVGILMLSGNFFMQANGAGTGGLGGRGGEDFAFGQFEPSGDGGRGGNGGAIFVGASGTLISHNDEIAGDNAGNGGAVFPSGSGAQSGMGGAGGGIYNAGDARLDGTTLASNSAGAGAGGFAAAGGRGGDGGGIYSTGSLTLVNSTLAGNDAGAGGAGASGTASGGGGNGGAIFTTSGARLVNDTISTNSAGAGAAGAGTPAPPGTGSGVFNASTTPQALSLGNTIIANNAAAGADPDVSSATAIASDGHNLIGVGSGTGWLASDQTGTATHPLDPRLAPLANYGGPMPVMPPLPGSPAIGGGDPALITNPPFTGPPFVDEQGQPRVTHLPDGSSRVDMGAVQFEPIPLVVTTTADGGDTPGELTLRSAIALADLIPGGHTITFSIPTTDPGYDASTGTFTIALASDGGPLELSGTSGTTSIDGPGEAMLIVSGDGLAPVLKVDAGVTAQLDGLTLIGGLDGIVNGGTLALANGAVSRATGSAGVMNNGTMTIDRSMISANAGIGLINAGNLLVRDSTISNNAQGGLANNSTLTMTQSTISANMKAGGITNSGTLTLTASTLRGNDSDRYGGAISSSGSTTIANCTIADNSADLGGGGLSVSDGSTTAINVTITANVVNGNGGGVEVLRGNLSLYNTIVAKNGDAFPAEDDIDGSLDAHLASGQSPSSNNLIGPGGSGGLTNGTNGNIVGVADPKLGPLADNGGPTQTIALLAGSPAIDHGSNALANAVGLTTDQRGYARVYNRVVDIGALESGSALPGDLNHDGTVNFADLLALAQHYGSTNATWEQGDLYGDGSVSFADLLTLSQNYGSGTTTEAAAVSGEDAPRLLRARAARSRSQQLQPDLLPIALGVS